MGSGRNQKKTEKERKKETRPLCMKGGSEMPFSVSLASEKGWVKSLGLLVCLLFFLT